MNKTTIKKLRKKLDNESISYDEIDDIESAFAEIPNKKLRDLRENATASDMLDELEAQTGLKQYRVGFWYTEYGTARIMAKTEQEAENKLHEFLGDSGDLNELDYECNDRDYGAQDAEEVK